MAVSAGLTDDAKQTVLDLHNQYRSRVANGKFDIGLGRISCLAFQQTDKSLLLKLFVL